MAGRRPQTSPVFRGEGATSRPSLINRLSSPVRTVSGNMHVRLIEARNLKKADFFGRSDPFVVLSVAGFQRQQSATKKRTTSPVWEETFVFTVSDASSQSLDIEVFDYDKAKKNENLGTIAIPIKSLPPSKAVDRWFPLEGVKTGEIHLEIRFTERSELTRSPVYRSRSPSPEGMSDGGSDTDKRYRTYAVSSTSKKTASTPPPSTSPERLSPQGAAWDEEERIELEGERQRLQQEAIEVDRERSGLSTLPPPAHDPPYDEAPTLLSVGPKVASQASADELQSLQQQVRTLKKSLALAERDNQLVQHEKDMLKQEVQLAQPKLHDMEGWVQVAQEERNRRQVVEQECERLKTEAELSKHESDEKRQSEISKLQSQIRLLESQLHKSEEREILANREKEVIKQELKVTQKHVSTMEERTATAQKEKEDLLSMQGSLQSAAPYSPLHTRDDPLNTSGGFGRGGGYGGGGSGGGGGDSFIQRPQTMGATATTTSLQSDGPQRSESPFYWQDTEQATSAQNRHSNPVFAAGDENVKREFQQLCLQAKMDMAEQGVHRNVLVDELYQSVIQNRIPSNRWEEYIKAEILKGRFMELCLQTKMDLAAEGYATQNVLIPDLFEKARRLNIPPKGWPKFMRQQLRQAGARLPIAVDRLRVMIEGTATESLVQFKIGSSEWFKVNMIPIWKDMAGKASRVTCALYPNDKGWDISHLGFNTQSIYGARVCLRSNEEGDGTLDISELRIDILLRGDEEWLEYQTYRGRSLDSKAAPHYSSFWVVQEENERMPPQVDVLDDEQVSEGDSDWESPDEEQERMETELEIPDPTQMRSGSRNSALRSSSPLRSSPYSGAGDQLQSRRRRNHQHNRSSQSHSPVRQSRGGQRGYKLAPNGRMGNGWTRNKFAGELDDVKDGIANAEGTLESIEHELRHATRLLRQEAAGGRARAGGRGRATLQSRSPVRGGAGNGLRSSRPARAGRTPTGVSLQSGYRGGRSTSPVRGGPVVRYDEEDDDEDLAVPASSGPGARNAAVSPLRSSSPLRGRHFGGSNGNLRSSRSPVQASLPMGVVVDHEEDEEPYHRPRYPARRPHQPVYRGRGPTRTPVIDAALENTQRFEDLSVQEETSGSLNVSPKRHSPPRRRQRSAGWEEEDLEISDRPVVQTSRAAWYERAASNAAAARQRNVRSLSPVHVRPDGRYVAHANQNPAEDERGRSRTPTEEWEDEWSYQRRDVSPQSRVASRRLRAIEDNLHRVEARKLYNGERQPTRQLSTPARPVQTPQEDLSPLPSPKGSAGPMRQVRRIQRRAASEARVGDRKWDEDDFEWRQEVDAAMDWEERQGLVESALERAGVVRGRGTQRVSRMRPTAVRSLSPHSRSRSRSRSRPASPPLSPEEEVWKEEMLMREKELRDWEEREKVWGPLEGTRGRDRHTSPRRVRPVAPPPTNAHSPYAPPAQASLSYGSRRRSPPPVAHLETPLSPSGRRELERNTEEPIARLLALQVHEARGSLTHAWAGCVMPLIVIEVGPQVVHMKRKYLPGQASWEQDCRIVLPEMPARDVVGLIADVLVYRNGQIRSNDLLGIAELPLSELSEEVGTFWVTLFEPLASGRRGTAQVGQLLFSASLNKRKMRIL